MNSIFKKALAGLLTVSLTVTSLAINIFADDTTKSPTISKTSEWVGDNGDILKVTLNLTAPKDGTSTITTNESADIVVVFDASDSMKTKDLEGKTVGSDSKNSRLNIAKGEVAAFAEKVLALNTNTDKNIRIGLVTFSNSAKIVKNFTTDSKNFTDGIVTGNGTNLTAGILKAKEMLASSNAANKYIVLITDGEPNYSIKGTETDGTYITAFGSESISDNFGFELGGSSYTISNPNAQTQILFAKDNNVNKKDIAFYNGTNEITITNKSLLAYVKEVSVTKTGSKYYANVDGKKIEINKGAVKNADSNRDNKKTYIYNYSIGEGLRITDNGKPAEDAARLLKSSDVTIYGIDFAYKPVRDTTKNCASKDCYGMAGNAETLKNILTNISSTITKTSKYCVGASVEDKIFLGETFDSVSPDFSFLNSGDYVPTINGVATNKITCADGIVKWDVGDVSGATVKAVYYLKLNKTAEAIYKAGDSIVLDKEAVLSYSTSEGENVKTATDIKSEPIKPTKTAYKVEFVANSKTIDTQYVFAGEDATEPTMFEKEFTEDNIKYTFSEWDKEFTNITADTTVTADYSKKTLTANYSIEYYFDGTINNDLTVTGNVADIGEIITEFADADINPAQYERDTAKSTSSLEISGNSEENIAKIYYTTKMYTIKFFDEGKTEPLSSADYAYGTKAADIVKPEGLTKPSTETETFKFNVWDPTVSDVTGDAEYVAIYSSDDRFYDYDVSYKVVDVNGNEVVGYEAPSPVSGKAALGTQISATEFDTNKFMLKDSNAVISITVQNDDTDAGINKLVIEIIPIFTVTTKYTLDGETIADDVVKEYGYNADYTTSGLSDYANEKAYALEPIGNSSGKVTDNIIVTYDYTTRKYTVTTKYTLDGETIADDVVKEYGYNADYTTSGLSDYANEKAYALEPIGNSSGKVTDNIIVTYDYTTRKYTVTTKYTLDGKTISDDVVKEYGYDADYTTSGLDAYANEKAYTLEITGNSSGKVTDNIVVTYVYKTIVYTVIYQDYNDEVLQQETYNKVDPNTAIPEYTSDEPTRESADGYSFKFAGWDDGEVGDDAWTTTIFTAQYEKNAIEYTVKYDPDNGTEIKTQKYDLTEGKTEPSSDTIFPEKPTKNSDGNFNYTFSKWELVSTSDDGLTKTYKAIYTATAIENNPPAPANPVVVIVDENAPLTDKPTQPSKNTGDKPADTVKAPEIIDIGDGETALSENPGTGVGLGGIIAGSSISLIVCAACVFGGKKKKDNEK